MANLGGADPISALASLLAPEAALTREMTYSYELRLHRARGYGALKGILDILARGGAADAHRDRPAPAAHARVDQGLPVVARRRRPGLGAAEAVQLRRPAAPPVGAPALPSRAARGRRGRPPGAALRAVTPAADRTRAGRSGRDESVRDYRDRLVQAMGMRHTHFALARSALLSASFAAACSASFFVLPSDSASTSAPDAHGDVEALVVFRADFGGHDVDRQRPAR